MVALRLAIQAAGMPWASSSANTINVKSRMKAVDALYQYDTLTRLNDSRFNGPISCSDPKPRTQRPRAVAQDPALLTTRSLSARSRSAIFFKMR